VQDGDDRIDFKGKRSYLFTLHWMMAVVLVTMVMPDDDEEAWWVGGWGGGVAVVVAGGDGGGGLIRCCGAPTRCRVHNRDIDGHQWRIAGQAQVGLPAL
jgi:hypothetical protein